MIQVWLYSLVSVFIVSLIAFIGVFTLPMSEKRLKNILLYFVSFSAGALLGDVFIHLLPEAVVKTGFTLNVSFYVLLGILASFILEKFIHVRHTHLVEKKKSFHSISTMSLVGDSIHNFIDGLIIGASYLVSISIGIATTIAVVLHEIPQEIGNFGVLLHGGYSKNRALFFNFITALTAFLGALISLTIKSTEGATNFLLPFAAGNFIYIAGSDLIPELHKEVSLKKNIFQFIFLIFGIVVMMALLLFD